MAEKLLNDQLSLNDAVDVQLSTHIYQDLASTLSLTDTVSTEYFLLQLLDDTLILGDAVRFESDGTGSIASALTLADKVDIILSPILAIASTLSLADAVEAYLVNNLTQDLADSFVLGDSTGADATLSTGDTSYIRRHLNDLT